MHLSSTLISLKKIPRVWLYRAALIGMLLAFTAVDLSLLPQKSMMVDDAIHLPSGYSYIETHDFRLNQEHPPLLKMLSAFGLAYVKPELPLDSDGWKRAEDPGDPDDGTNTFCEDFFHRNADKYDQIIFWGRVPMVIVPLLLAIALWAFGNALFGEGTGLMTVFLFLTEPNIIGNATIVQDDLASALAVLLFVITLRAYFRKPGFIRVVLLGVSISVGLLVKHSLALLVPITLVLLLLDAVWRKFKHKEHLCRYLGFGCLIFTVAYILFIAGYAFDVGFLDDDEAVFISEWFRITGSASESFQSLLTHLPILLPRYYLYGMDMVVNDVRNGRPAFLFGQVSDQGWWYYFPAAFALKTTIPFLLITISGLIWTGWEIVKKRWADGLYILIPPVLYLGLSMTSHLNIGVRHIMPIFPFFAMMGAAAISTFFRNSRFQGWRKSIVLPAAFLLWTGAIVVINYPNYLTHFSPLVGGRSNGWRLLSDSNVETGQEVKNLAEYLKERGETKVNGLFMGSEYIDYYGIENCDLPCTDDNGDENADAAADDNVPDNSDHHEPEDEVSTNDKPADYVAIGAWYLQEVDVTPEQRLEIDKYRNEQPEAMVGNSIFVFHVRDRPAE